MSTQAITLKITEAESDVIEVLVKMGFGLSRSDLLRNALHFYAGHAQAPHHLMEKVRHDRRTHKPRAFLRERIA